jgi:ABC-type phosphate transport system ATPase subunit
MGYCIGVAFVIDGTVEVAVTAMVFQDDRVFPMSLENNMADLTTTGYVTA